MIRRRIITGVGTPELSPGFTKSQAVRVGGGNGAVHGVVATFHSGDRRRSENDAHLLPRRKFKVGLVLFLREDEVGAELVAALGDETLDQVAAAVV